MGEGGSYCGGVTQGGARSSLALGWYVSPFQGFWEGDRRRGGADHFAATKL